MSHKAVIEEVQTWLNVKFAKRARLKVIESALTVVRLVDVRIENGNPT
jgi:hypothetical protein